MRIGKLRHQIDIQQVVIGTGPRGGVTRTWTTFATVHAEMIDAAGREFDTGMKVSAEINKVFRIRYRSGITPQHRVLFEGSYFDINSVVDRDGRRRELLLVCKAVS